MSSFAAKEGLQLLQGEAEEVLEMMAADCETADQWGHLLEVPLERACISGNTKLATKLVLAGARVGSVAFLNAAAFDRWDTLLELLSLTRRTRNETTVLIHDMIKTGGLLETLCKVVGKGRPRVVRALLDAGAGHVIGRALTTAVRNAGPATEEIVNDLLDQPGAAKAINWFENEKQNPLLIASRRGLHRICSTLLGKGADVNAQSGTNGPTPLYNAVLSGNLETVHVLLRAGADPRVACSVGGRTVVHTASQKGDCCAGILRALIKHGADVSALDDQNVTPLHLAVGIAPSCTQTLGLLVDAGADLNARKTAGNTPLHSAARRLKADAVRALLWYGADETLGTKNNGKTPLDVVGMRVKENQASANDFGIVRKLLIGAPAERAWRRRSCIVLCRARCASLVATSMTHRVRRSQRLCSRHSEISKTIDGFGDIVRAASDDVFRKIVGYL